MAYKITLALETESPQDKDELVRRIRAMLFAFGIAPKGKLRVVAETDWDAGEPVTLYPLGILDNTPMGDALATLTPDTTIPDKEDEPPTPFDKLLGREREDGDD